MQERPKIWYVLATVAVLLIACATAKPAQAQEPREGYWGGVDDIADNFRSGFAGGIARGLCANHSINGKSFDHVGDSWCDGMVYDSKGRLEGCNANALRPNPDCPDLLRGRQGRDSGEYRPRFAQRRSYEHSARTATRTRDRRVPDDYNDRPSRQPQRVVEHIRRAPEPVDSGTLDLSADAIICNPTGYAVLVIDDNDKILGKISPGMETTRGKLPAGPVILTMSPADRAACQPDYDLNSAGEGITISCTKE